MTTATPEGGSPFDDERLDRRLDRAIARARAVLLWEVVWAEAVVPLGVVGLWVALSWLGVWEIPEAGGRAVLAGALGLGFVATTARALLRISRSLPSEAEAIARVEAASGLGEREISARRDRLADDGASAATRALWAAHRRRNAARLDRLVVGLPHPDVARRDRFALRPLLGFALFVGWFAASGAHLERLGGAFRASGETEVADRLDVWIDPPGHVGKAPQVLMVEGGAVAAAATGPIEVAAGSRLVVRVSPGRVGAPVRPPALTARPESAARPEAGASGGPESRWVLERDGEVILAREGRAAETWRFAVAADRAPEIRLLPSAPAKGRAAFRLAHETEDDWGVVGAEARLAVPRADGARPLWDDPRVPLVLPPGGRGLGRAETERDLGAHPFAGGEVEVVLTARDALGQEGASEPTRTVLPQRAFRAPSARALVELRGRLARDARAIDTVRTALDALTLAPDRFGERPGSHLGLRHLAAEAMRATSDDELRALVDLLWTAALTIDGGDTLDEEKALREAREALRAALDRGASEEEIARLTQELRKAMEAWLKARAEAVRRNPDLAPPGGERGRRVSEKDLNRMLDRIEQAARTGSRAAAEQLLSELGETLDNLRVGRSSPGRGGDLDALGDLMKRQRELMEETHRADGEGTTPQQRDALTRRQERLREDLQRLQRQIGRQGQGMPGRGAPSPGGSGNEPGGADPGEALGEADRAMGDAGRAIEADEGEEAGEAQGRALEAMRRGALALADRGAGEDGRDGPEANGDDEDPFGRPRRSTSSGSSRVKIPEEIDMERARRILDELRRRASEFDRPRPEKDYLERLLKLD